MKDLLLAKLNEEQIQKAKEVNGKNKRITHVLICGDIGQMFGTEKQCLKYYNAWSDIFKELFPMTKKKENIEDINDFKTTFDLVNKLIPLHDNIMRSSKEINDRFNLVDQKNGVKVVQNKKSIFKKILGI